MGGILAGSRAAAESEIVVGRLILHPEHGDETVVAFKI